MQVRKLRILPIEAIVRGYITGSAWKEYQKSGTVHGIPVPAGLKESEAFPNGPIYTPSTKAEQGEHDENIHPDQGMSSFRYSLRDIVLENEANFEKQLPPFLESHTPQRWPNWL